MSRFYEHCLCKFIFLGIEHCNDESGLTSAGNLFNKVWKSCSEIMNYTNSLHSCKQFMEELVSTLLDKISKNIFENKVCIIKFIVF